MEGFDGPFEKNKIGELLVLKATVAKKSSTGYILDARANQTYKALNILLKEGIDVFRIADTKNNPAYSNGSFYVPSSAKTKTAIDKIVNENYVQFIPAAQKPVALTKIKKARIALWDNYGGSMSSGWVRFILEQYDYSFDVVYVKDIDTGNLKSLYDVIVFVEGAIPAVGARTPVRNARRREDTG